MSFYQKIYHNVIFTFVLVCLIPIIGRSQTYNMGAGTTSFTTCAGTFYDSGGSGVSYTAGENRTITFTSSNSKPMTMNFTSFALQGGTCDNDYIEIYNGNSTGAALIGRYCGSNSPGFITGSGTSLTVKFVSDGTSEAAGWAATLGCYSCIDNSTCATQYVDLDFSDNSITKTADPANWVGDEWQFDNVYAGTYAKAKIVGVQNVVSTAISNIDNATEPFPQAWSPELGFNVVAGQDSYVDWEVTFYDNTTNAVKPLPKASRVTSYDVDGPNNRNPYTEMHGHTGPDGYIVGSTSQLSVLNEPPRTTVLGSPEEYTGISNNDFSKITFYYSASLTVFKIRLGIRAAVGAPSSQVPARQYALGFLACPNFDNPVVNPVINQISGPASLCINNRTQTYSVTNNFSSIVWSALGGTINSGQGTPNVSITWNNAAGNYKVSVVTTDGSSCVVNNSRAVTVYNLPTAGATSSTPTVCTGQTINLSASGGTSYSWSGPSSFTSTSQAPSRTNATTAMAGTYTVTVTDVNGCSSTATTSVTVNTTPTISITATSANICQGTTIVSFAYTSPTGSPNAYSIDFVSGITDISFTTLPASPINVTVPAGIAPGTYTGTLTVRNANNCVSGGTIITIIVDNPATVEAGNDITQCFSTTPSAITLVGATRGGGSTNAAWTIVSGDGSLSNLSFLTNPATVTYTAPAYIPANGNYSIDVVLRLTTDDPSGACPSVFDNRLLFINYIIGGAITGDQTICTDGNPSVISNN